MLKNAGHYLTMQGCPKPSIWRGGGEQCLSSTVLWWFSQSVVSDSLQPHALEPTRLFCPWESPGKNTEVGCYARLQIFLTQESNPSLLPYRQILYHLSYKGSPKYSTVKCSKARCLCVDAIFLFLIKSRLVYKEVLNKTGQVLKYYKSPFVFCFSEGIHLNHF